MLLFGLVPELIVDGNVTSFISLSKVYFNVLLASLKLSFGTQAIKSVFKEAASDLVVSSTKSMTGHLLGAAGAVEAIFSILSLRDNVCPPTINLDNHDTGCDLNYSPKISTEKSVEYSLSNSFGFGGTNATLIFKQIE